LPKHMATGKWKVEEEKELKKKTQIRNPRKVGVRLKLEISYPRVAAE
jgi:hypothetical protein